MSKEWLKNIYGSSKPIVAMCHLDALPGDPRYDESKGMSYVLDRAYKNLCALQDGGVDAVMFSNEFSLPYQTKVDAITAMAMANIIGQLKSEIREEHIMQNAGLDDSQAGIKIAGRNINNLRYADDTTLMPESKRNYRVS